MDERHSDADDSPGDHDAREPATRAPFFDDDRTRNFEQEVTGEENSGTEAEHAIVEAQLPRHLERGRGNIRAVEESDDVEDREVRQQAECNATARAVGDLRRIRDHAPPSGRHQFSVRGFSQP